jgi:signal transduction histidine kinase
VAYALISVVIILIYVAAISVLRLLTEDSRLPRGAEITVLAALVAGVPLITWVRRAAFSFVDRVLYKDTVDHQQIIHGLSLDASRVEDLPALIGGVLKRIAEGLSLEFAAYVTREQGKDVELKAAHGPVRTGLLLSLMGAEDAWGRAPATVWKLRMPESEGELLAGAVRGLGAQPGVIVLGPRSSGEGFSREDSAMLQTVCGLLSTAMARVQLLGEVEKSRQDLADLATRLAQEGEQERAEIASYLHDEPLQKVAYTLSQFKQRALPADLANMLEQVARDLRTMSASLGPDLLRDLGVVRAVEWLAHENDRQGPFRVFFDAGDLGPDERFHPDVELAVYRTVQESLTNCRKHARAKAAWVELKRLEGDIAVSVEDNGIGISANAGPGHGERPQLGLAAMRRRVTRLGGQLEIGPNMPRGTRVMARIPALPAGMNGAAGRSW